MRVTRVAHRPVPRRATREIAVPAKRRTPVGLHRDRGRRAAQPASEIDVKIPLGVFCVRDRRVRLGQVDARQRDPVQGGRQPAAPRASSGPGAHRAVSGLDQLDKIINIDQSPIGRTPRSNPATYTGLFDHIRDLYSQHAGGAGARLQAGPLLVQREGRALRGLPRRRPDQDRDALPARRLRARASSATASATTARRSTSASRARRSPTCSTCRSRRRSSSSRTSRRSSAACRRCTTSGSTTSGSASPRRRCPAARRSA